MEKLIKYITLRINNLVHTGKGRYLTLAFVLLIPFTAQSSSKNHKYQDGEYNRFICNQLGGKTEVKIPGSGRADCMGENFVAEIEFADLWKQGIEQVIRYSNGASKKGLLILVIEDEDEQVFVKSAKSFIQKNYPKSNISIKEFDSKRIKIASNERPCVKLSRSKICHAINTGSYGNTIHFKPFKSMSSCIQAGGRRAKNIRPSLSNKNLKKNNCGL